MIVGIGVDIVEVERIFKLIQKGLAHTNKVFTEKEQVYSNQVGFESYAGKFAAKEALFKAIGTGWRGEMEFTDIEILHSKFGQPYIVLHHAVKDYFDTIANTIHLSISHTSTIATAYVIIEKIEVL